MRLFQYKKPGDINEVHVAYKIHHLNTATLCPGTQRLVNGAGSLVRKGKLVCHCLLVETDDGLVLIDTGFGLNEVLHGDLRDKLAMASLGAVGDPDECAVNQVRRLGFRPDDVRHIVLTHLDTDHAGGIKDFPQATVHLHQNEFIAGMQPITWFEKIRYQPGNWRHQPNWKTHQPVGEKWQGFDSVRLLSNQLYDILLIPLTGHSRGHSGVAISTTEGWLLHCGDAYFSHQEIKSEKPTCPPMLQAVQTMDESSRADRLYNQQRLRELYRDHHSDIRLICSHDHEEFEACCHYNAFLGHSRAETVG
ncbi:MAG: MBL fold metallo-hydrolase [Ketobacteraceae bacterium]|nr:MBL fold metallo-hydrolase [Ketobacteraceae bacterium]